MCDVCPTVAGAASGKGRCGGWGRDMSAAPRAWRQDGSLCPGCLQEESNGVQRSFTLSWPVETVLRSTEHTQRPGQVLKHLSGYERLRELPEVQFEDPGNHIYLSGPQPGHCFTQI